MRPSNSQVCFLKKSLVKNCDHKPFAYQFPRQQSRSNRTKTRSDFSDSFSRVIEMDVQQISPNDAKNVGFSNLWLPGRKSLNRFSRNSEISTRWKEEKYPRLWRFCMRFFTWLFKLLKLSWCSACKSQLVRSFQQQAFNSFCKYSHRSCRWQYFIIIFQRRVDGPACTWSVTPDTETFSVNKTVRYALSHASCLFFKLASPPSIWPLRNILLICKLRIPSFLLISLSRVFTKFEISDLFL